MEGSEESSKNLCECYKKLGLLGIPLYINEESGDFGEDRPQINYETAFRFPELLRIDENIGEYPVVGDNDLSNVFEDMSRVIIGLADYDVNVLSFWILDMFIEGLWTSQKAGMEHDHQKATLLWIAYFFNYIIRQNPTRKEMFRHLKDVLFCPEGGDGMTALDSDKEDPSSLEGTEMWSRIETKKQIWNLPLPPPLDEPGKDEEGFFSKISSSKTSTKSPSLSSIECTSEINVIHMNAILEILFRIFGRLWVYLEIRSCLNEMPNVETVDIPFVLHAPKPRFKSEVPVSVKSGKRQVTQEKTPEELQAEMELHKADYILPLQHSEEAKAMTAELFGQSTNDKKGKDKKK